MSQIDKEQALRYDVEAWECTDCGAVGLGDLPAECPVCKRQRIPPGHVVVPAALITAIRALLYAAFMEEDLDDYADEVNKILDALPKATR